MSVAEGSTGLVRLTVRGCITANATLPPRVVAPAVVCRVAVGFTLFTVTSHGFEAVKAPSSSETVTLTRNMPLLAYTWERLKARVDVLMVSAAVPSP